MADAPATIERALAAMADKLRGSGAAWIVGGSAGLMLRGIRLSAPPRDLDVYADPADAALIHAALADAAVDRPVRSATAIYESLLSHYRESGVAVELVGGFIVSARGCRYETKVRERLLPHAEWRTLPGGAEAPLVPLAHELWFNWLRGRDDRVAPIAAAIAANPARHMPAFRDLTAAGKFATEAVSAVEAALAAAAAAAGGGASFGRGRGIENGGGGGR